MFIFRDIHETAMEAARRAAEGTNGTLIPEAESLHSDNSTFNPNFTQVPEDQSPVNADGCVTKVRDDLERQCSDIYEEAISHSIHILDSEQNEKMVCCSLEDYEKCSYRSYRKANCENDHKSLKETLKAARIFMAALTNLSCSGHRGQCGAVMTSSADPVIPSYAALLALCILPFLKGIF